MQGKRLFDVSMTLDAATPVWPGNPTFRLDPVKDISRGDSSNVSRLEMGTHSGTHVDAPRHFLTGAAGVDALDPALLVGEARLFQLGDIPYVDAESMAALDLTGVSRLLLGTRNSSLLRSAFTDDFAYLDEGAARYLQGTGVRLLGVDYLSVEAYRSPGHPAHRVLLASGVVILEGLDLQDVPAGDYELLCLPLKLRGADGAPARVLLREL